MLERAVNCLESTPRRISKQTAVRKGRRNLHTSFWQHGAADNGLPFWWSTFTQPLYTRNQEGIDTSHEGYSARDGKDDNQDLGLLEFLYPRETLSWLTRRLRTRHTGSTTKLSVTGSRQFSSIKGRAAGSLSVNGIHEQYDDGGNAYATEQTETTQLASGVRAVDANENVQQDQTKPDQLPAEVRRLLDKTGGDVPAVGDFAPYEEAWQLFDQVDKTRIRLDTVRHLTDFLSFSSRGEDRIRLGFLLRRYFADTDPRARMTLLLQEGNIHDAAQLFETDLSTLRPSDAGIDLLLAHALRRSEWAIAFRIGGSYMKQNRLTEDKHLGRVHARLFSLSYRLPDYLQTVASAARHLQDHLSPAKPSEELYMQRLAQNVFYAHVGSRLDFDLAVQLLDQMASMNLATPKFYETLVLHLFNGMIGIKYQSTAGSVTKRRLIFDIYARCQRAGYILSRWNLSRILVLLSQPTDQPLEVEPHVVSQQYRNEYGDLDRYAENAMVKLLARDKTTEEARGLVNTLRASKDSTSSHLWPLLQLYTQRSQWKEILTEFRQVLAEDGPAASDAFCWNSYLNALAKLSRYDDIPSALEEMIARGLRPDKHSYISALWGLAVRGQPEGVLELLGAIKEQGLTLDSSLLSYLVSSYVKADRMAGAEDAARLIVNTPEAYKSKADLTDVWNHVLDGYAALSDLAAVQRILAEMSDLSIPLDGRSYLSLITALYAAHESDAAYRVMTEVMPANGVPALQYHYAAVMHGFWLEKKYNQIILVFEDIQKRGLEPELDVWREYIRALANIEIGAHFTSRKLERQLWTAIETLRSSINSEKTSLSMQTNHLTRRPDSRDPFEGIIADLIRTYVRAPTGYKRTVSRLIDKYAEHRQASSSKSLPSVPMLQALIEASTMLQRNDDVDHYWNLCIVHADSQSNQQANRLHAQPERLQEDDGEEEEDPSVVQVAHESSEELDAPEIHPITGQPFTKMTMVRRGHGNKEGRAIESIKRPLALSDSSTSFQQHILARPFNSLLRSWSNQKDYAAIRRQLTFLLEAGYKLHSPAWNFVVTTLLQSRGALNILTAFQYCEEYLMPNFQGWVTSSQASRLHRESLRKKVIDKHLYMNLPPLGKGGRGSLNATFLLPQTDTILRLRDIFFTQLGELERVGVGTSSSPSKFIEIIKKRKGDVGEDGNVVVQPEIVRLEVTTEALEAVAPRTVEALRTVPEVAGRVVS